MIFVSINMKQNSLLGQKTKSKWWDQNALPSPELNGFFFLGMLIFLQSSDLLNLKI